MPLFVTGYRAARDRRCWIPRYGTALRSLSVASYLFVKCLYMYKRLHFHNAIVSYLFVKCQIK